MRCVLGDLLAATYSTPTTPSKCQTGMRARRPTAVCESRRFGHESYPTPRVITTMLGLSRTTRSLSFTFQRLAFLLSTAVSTLHGNTLDEANVRDLVKYRVWEKRTHPRCCLLLIVVCKTVWNMSSKQAQHIANSRVMKIYRIYNTVMSRQIKSRPRT